VCGSVANSVAEEMSPAECRRHEMPGAGGAAMKRCCWVNTSNISQIGRRAVAIVPRPPGRYGCKVRFIVLIVNAAMNIDARREAAQQRRIG